MKRIIIIIAVIVVVIVAAAAVFLFVLPKGEEPAPESSIYTPGDFFITNVKGSGSLVKTTIVLEVNRGAGDAAFHKYLSDHNHIIRDTIVFVLNSKTYEQLRSDDVKRVLTDEIVQKVNENLGIDNVTTIYFNDYVVQ